MREQTFGSRHSGARDGMDTYYKLGNFLSDEPVPRHPVRSSPGWLRTIASIALVASATSLPAPSRAAPFANPPPVQTSTAIPRDVPAMSRAASPAGTPVAEPAGTIVLRGAPGTDITPLRLHPPPASDPRTRRALAGWRHEFDIVLTADGPNLVIHDERGERHRFVQAPTTSGWPTPMPPPSLPPSLPPAATPSGIDVPPTRFTSGMPGSSVVTRRDGEHVWTRADGREVVFHGSRPVRVAMPDGGDTTLEYDRGRLVSIVRSGEPATTLAYREQGAIAITFGDGTRHDVVPSDTDELSVRRHAQAGECRPVEERCDTAANPPAPGFASAPGIPGAIRVDARPASCQSYFVEHHGTDRGVAIELGLDGLPYYAGYISTVSNFPIVDFAGAELRVIRSRDLALPSYDTVADGLYERLLRDGREIAERLIEPLAREGRLASTALGRTTALVHRPGRPVVLELVVRHGLASPDQRRQITRARAELLARRGIVLRVIEIP